MGRLILHLDLNNFYASVECLKDPSVRDKPVAVAGSPDKRHGVVLAKNEIAKKLGVKTGDTVLDAQRKAPGIVFKEPDFAEYDQLSKKMFDICRSVTSQVEAFGADECWLDCTASQKLFGDGKTIADGLRERIKTEMNLTASVGVSFTKSFAKLGSDMKKPDATTVIDESNFKEKVWPLPVQELCGIGHQIAKNLNKMNIRTLGQLACADGRILSAHFGKVGIDLKNMAAGLDTTEIREAALPRDVKSISHSLTTLRDLVSDKDIRALVYYLSELVAARLAKKQLRASGVAVHVRFAELDFDGKQTALPAPVRSASDIAECAITLALFLAAGRRVRLIGVAAFHLTDEHAPAQLSFFDNAAAKKSEANEKLDAALTSLRGRFGNAAVRRATQIDTDIFTEKDVGDFLPFKR